MPIYAGYDDPYKLAERGIDILSIVYGVVPIHADGTPLREDGRIGGNNTEYPRSDTLKKVAKGMVAHTTREHVIGLFAEIKVMWQPSAIGRLSLSHGVGRWPHTADLFTAQEVADTVNQRDHAIVANHWGDSEPPTFNSDPVVTGIDNVVDHPLGNTLLRIILEETVAERSRHAFEVFRNRDSMRVAQ